MIIKRGMKQMLVDIFIVIVCLCFVLLFIGSIFASLARANEHLHLHGEINSSS